MKYYRFFISTVLGISVGLSAYELKIYFIKKNFQNSADNILNFNPYSYEVKSKASTSYFYTGLPLAVRNEIQKKQMSFDYLTSCEADIIPGGHTEFVVGFFNKGKPHLDIFEMENQYKVKKMTDISSLLKNKQQDVDDYLELRCSPLAILIGNSKFQMDDKDASLIDEIKRSNRELVKVTQHQSRESAIIGYNPADQHFYSISATKNDGI